MPEVPIRDLELQTLPNALVNFGLTAPRRVEPVEFAYANHIYLVDTDEGGYVVKFLLEVDEVGIENDAHIQGQLNRAGIPTSSYLKGKEDKYVYRGNGLTAVVSKRLDRIVPEEVTPGLAFQIGKTLAGFHNAVTPLPHPHIGYFNPEVVGDVEGAELFSADLPRGVMHTDLHRENVLVSNDDPDEIVAIFDFDDVEEGPFIIDIGRTILGNCVLSDEAQQDLMDALLEGYNSVRQITDEERQNLPLAIKYAATALNKWMAERGYDDFVRIVTHRAESFTRLRM